MKRTRGVLILGWVVLAALMLPGCGGGGGPTGPTIVRRTDNVTGNLVRLGFERRDLTTNAAGAVNVTLDWNSTLNDLDIYVTPTSCSSIDDAIANRGACVAIVRADGVTTKPERVTYQASANSTTRIWVYNDGPFSDSYRLAIEYPVSQ